MKAASRPRGIFWPEPDGFFGTFKSLWIINPEERRRLILPGFICAFLTPLVTIFCRLESPGSKVR